MAKAIKQLRSGRTIGIAHLGLHGDDRGSVRQSIHDGDTAIVDPNGNLSVRFLGIDTPEISFMLGDTQKFISIGNPAWEEFISSPFEQAPAGYTDALGKRLTKHIKDVTGQGVATNHFLHAKAAERTLEALVESDMEALGKTKEDFQFFMAFSREVMDGYGRLLCYLNRDQPNRNVPSERPLSYNERLLQSGFASPYFIWPNVNPFIVNINIMAAVPTPENKDAIANSNAGLGKARKWVKSAREQKIGLYEDDNGLRLQPFELRFLARQKTPTRWVIDLSTDDNILYQPINYPKIQHIEDRLFIPVEYVPLFVEHGWEREGCH